MERPWLGLVAFLPESGRLQTNDLGEERISVRFVSAERTWKIVYLTKPRMPKIMHKILWKQKCNELQNIWLLIYRRCCPLQILAHTEEIADSVTACAVKNNLCSSIHADRNVLDLNCHIRKQMYVFQDYYYIVRKGAKKKYQVSQSLLTSKMN